MSTPLQTDVQNRLFALMLPGDFARLAPHLELIDTPRHFVMAEAGQTIEHVYFPDSGIGSIVATSPEGQETEAGIFGFEGFVPTATVMGSDVVVNRTIMQVGGKSYHLPRSALTAAVDESPTLRTLLLRYTQVMSVQTSFTLLSNTVHQLDERLARWLLMCHDRSLSDDIPLTHEFLSLMLAVRRPSVTNALHVLEGNGFIQSERGWVTIRNRMALEEFAADAYGQPEAEYRRLLGPMR